MRRAEPDRRSGTEQHRGQQHRCECRPASRASRVLWCLRRREDEAIDARVQVAERSQLLPEIVDALVRDVVRTIGRRRRSQAPRRDERRQLPQPVGARAERDERAIGGLAQLGGQLARAVHAAE